MKILKTTAIKDEYTQDIDPFGNTIWGWGKVNAYGAVQLAELITPRDTNHYGLEGAIVYPNPSNGKFKVIFKDRNNKSLQFSVFDIHGRLICKGTQLVTDKIADFDLSGHIFANGMYIFRLYYMNSALMSRLYLILWAMSLFSLSIFL